MKATWLGQGGWLLRTGDVTILVDPYLSDSVEKLQPHNRRRVPVDPALLQVKPDVIVLTHDHLDHTDPETLGHYLKEDTAVTVLASFNAWQIARKIGGLGNNYTMFDKGTRWTEKGVVFRAVHAEHSDLHAVGVMIYAEGRRFYITGDTLYNERVFADLTEKPDFVFLPVNGRGNNMNMTEAADFCRHLGATAIPMHCGLFDALDMHALSYEPKIVPEFYKEFTL